MKKSQFFLDRESREQRVPPYRFRQKSMILDKFNVFGTIRRCYLNHLWTRICLNIYRFYYRKQILLKILVAPRLPHRTSVVREQASEIRFSIRRKFLPSRTEALIREVRPAEQTLDSSSASVELTLIQMLQI